MQACGRAYEDGLSFDCVLVTTNLVLELQGVRAKEDADLSLEPYAGYPNCIPERSRHLAVARNPAK